MRLLHSFLSKYRLYIFGDEAQMNFPQCFFLTCFYLQIQLFAYLIPHAQSLKPEASAFHPQDYHQVSLPPYHINFVYPLDDYLSISYFLFHCYSLVQAHLIFICYGSLLCNLSVLPPLLSPVYSMLLPQFSF